MEITITDAFDILEMTLDTLDAPSVAKEALTFIHEYHDKLSGIDVDYYDEMADKNPH